MDDPALSEQARNGSSASFMSIARSEGPDANGYAAPGSPSKLSEELGRRLQVADSNPAQPQAALALSTTLSSNGSGLPPPHEFTFFCELRHDEALPPSAADQAAAAQQQQQQAAGQAAMGASRQLASPSGTAATGEGLVSKWRQKERLKTTAVALVMCLNIGVDPPDVIKISPCARLECWVDPLSMQAPKALDTIGKNLQAQYERWQPRAKYKMHLDPTTEDVKKLAISCRRTAKGERVLFHYNGHGVPRPTANGEVWVFNKSYTQYIPLSVYDLQTWVGTPAIYVFDCSAAGQILYSFRQFMFQRQQELEGGYMQHQAAAAAAAGSTLPAGLDQRPDPMRDCILLCACGEAELLPQNPDLPADTFTSCLTTPIKVALRWFCSRSLLRHEGITKELIDRIPGKQTDRKTPLGELNWVFTAITDTIAWNVLPRALFQKLFRQDLLVASLFRNFLLAERIMRAANCNPVSYPRLPPTHQHPMWQAWDMAAEMCLLQLPDLLSGDGSKEYQPSPFFSEQLTAFELWLEHGGPDKKPPEQLPIVLQVLLSQVHRLRALVLLGRFLDMGAWAVDLALSVGIFPYVLKLLQTTATDLRQTLVLIWAKIMAWDTNSQVQSDLVKDGGHLYFVKHLESRDPGVSPESRAQAAFVLAAICSQHAKGQLLCAQSGLLQVCIGQLPAALAALASAADADFVSGAPGGGSAKSMALLVRWLLLCTGKLCENAPEVTAMALREQTHEMLAKLLGADNPDVRAAAVYTLGAFIQVHEGGGSSSVGSLGRLSPSSSMVGAASGVGPAPASGVGAEGGGAGGGGGAGAAAAAEGPLPEAERLAVERAIACALLEVVYDASPTVRAEVAVALARVAVGHSLLFQDAVHAHQRTSARIMREQQQSAAAAPGPQVAASAPAAAGVARSAPTAAAGAAGGIGRVSSSGSISGSGGRQGVPQAASAAPATGPLQPQSPPAAAGTAPAARAAGSAGQQGLGSSPGAVRGASLGTSPGSGVRLREDSSYEPMLHVGLDHSNLGGVYASADAARVGGGLYQAVVEALCTLATDPSPSVAAAGLAALRAAGVELVPVAAAGPAGGRGTAPAPSRVQSLSGSGALPVGTPTGGGGGAALASSSGGVSSMLPKSWQPKSWRTSSGGGGGGSSGGAATSLLGGSSSSRQLSSASSAAPGVGLLGGGSSSANSPSPSPTGSGTYTRTPFILRRAPDAGDSVHLQRSYSKESAAYGEQQRSLSAAGSMGSLDAYAAAAAGAAATVHLPPSGIYASSCRAFTWPLLAPQSQEEPGPTYATWLLPPDESKVELRRQHRHDMLWRTRSAMQSPKCRLRDQVTTVNTEAEHTAALLLEPLRPFLVTADSKGVLRISNYRSGGLVNRFHAASGVSVADSSPAARAAAAGGQAACVRALYMLNELHNGLLMCCAADGSVRIWRNYALRGQQRLASAWQSTLVPAPGSGARPAAYHWSPGYSALFAAGGRSAERVNMWDIERENCIAQLTLPAPASASAGPAVVEHIAASACSPLLYAADATGSVRIFDLRSSELVGSVQHLRSRLCGLVAEPGGTPHHLVLGYPSAQLAFLDCRMLSDSAAAAAAPPAAATRRLEVGVWKAVEAHSRGTMTALAAHPNASLLATATSSQVVKVWSACGEQVGVVRAHSSFLATHRIGPVTCLSFAPYELLLGSGSADPMVAIYGLEAAPAAPSLPSSPARPPLAPLSAASTPSGLLLPPSLSGSQTL